jgi:hypothetical protein
MRSCDVPCDVPAAAADTPLTVWGTGAPLRQFLYNIDFGKLLVRVQNTES